MFVLLTVPVSGQVIESFEFERGEGAALPIDNAYLIIGDKVDRSFRTDYYVDRGVNGIGRRDMGDPRDGSRW